MTATTPETTVEPSASQPTFIVGIGASAGGLNPIEEFFDHMPVDTGMAFVVVQHLSPDFKSLMDELLARHTRMAIHKVIDSMEVEANSIYLIPPEKNMALSEGRLLLTDQESHRGLNLPIDIFFRSLAKDAAERAIAIVLSGTGSDGSRGIKDVHEAGGIVLAQNAETAGFDGMPRAAMQTGVVDVALAPNDLAVRVIEYSKEKDKVALQRVEGATKLPSGEPGLFSIFNMFRLHHGIDFALYKPATIHRRLERRMQISGFTDLDKYAVHIEEDEEERDYLFRDLLVEVTQFFRDEAAFRRLREDIIPQLVDRSEAGEEIRIWVPGCATGEEAYSMAILFDEAIANANRSQDFKVFATDVHRTSLETASTAVYPIQALEVVPADLQGRYFTKSNGLCHIKREVRQKVIFAANDLTSDPPFTRLDLISCRNVLIYLEPKVQKRVLSLFHFGLKTGGTLFLGPSESVSDLESEFDTIDRHWRIYRKRRDVRLPEATRMPMTPVLSSVVLEKHNGIVASPFKAERAAWVSTAMEDLLTRYVPPSLMINDQQELVHTFGDARKLLVQPEGRPTLDALKMLDGEMRTAVSTALHRARQENQAVTLKGIRREMDNSDEFELYKVKVEPYRKANRNLYLVILEKQQETLAADASIIEELRREDRSDERILQLERELNYTRETLQATVEELESSNEELQATNEELIASNEELQSTNEELHSVNEELYTVNSEHKQKIEELTQLTSDMDNLLKSTDIGTIFLDHEFRIRMYTPAISAAFNVMEQDIGRPIDNIAYKLDSPNLLADAAEVLSTLQAKEVEVQSADGSVYLQRMQPYRTENDAVQGVVLTTTDITALREAEQAQRSMMTQINEELPDFAYAVSHDLQAPLRHISQYSKILDEAAESGQVEQIPKATKVIHDSANAMHTMLGGLLSYSRINSRARPMAPVELSEVLDEAVKSLSGTIEFNQANFMVDKLPVVSGDRAQLQTVFFHLFDNAIKYRSEEQPQVNVSYHRADGFVVISVADNGIGIDERHKDRVFTIFKRLGYKEDAPGIGIGLALCKRIVVRHGGRIWVEPNSPVGSIFKFTLREFAPVPPSAMHSDSDLGT
ncbi:chemotaxis protein CheB [Fuerstiella marisgermanici]|uniref:histidine kinase n=1 Tax=Fuerstiella marisgermanici TaxID=1891926 RepID=A0A1P8WDS0_9PLAN|nr:chemotaxis protein CheB [Fuerstiella marisgermanici]APZ92228.1 Phytochrome-like protein cph [Fuerstiella marisgermanici]